MGRVAQLKFKVYTVLAVNDRPRVFLKRTFTRIGATLSVFRRAVARARLTY